MESGLRPEGKKGESETAASRFFLKLRELAAALSHHHAPGLAQTARGDARPPGRPSPAAGCFEMEGERPREPQEQGDAHETATSATPTPAEQGLRAGGWTGEGRSETMAHITSHGSQS